MNNIPKSILEKIGKNLHQQDNHPIKILKDKIFSCLSEFANIDNIDPYVSVEDNFSSLRIPKDHPSRSLSDTFYKNDKKVLRTHMTAHLTSLTRGAPVLTHTKDGDKYTDRGYNRFVTCGDVYRKDEIDRSHYPVFHQIDGYCLLKNNDMPSVHLRDTINNIIVSLFGDKAKYRFIEDHEDANIYFPFTVNSCEVEVEFVDQNTGEVRWLEVLGAGTVHPEIMKNIGREGERAWAFGMGLERLAMPLFNIPDIRLFWSDDKRFLVQFKNGEITQFAPFSKYPICYKDISFWITPEFNEREMLSLIRDEGNDLIEEVRLLDIFTNVITKKISHCYRITYRHNSKSLTNKEINMIQDIIRIRLEKEFNAQVR